jgi:hypothetical protein
LCKRRSSGIQLELIPERSPARWFHIEQLVYTLSPVLSEGGIDPVIDVSIHRPADSLGLVRQRAKTGQLITLPDKLLYRYVNDVGQILAKQCGLPHCRGKDLLGVFVKAPDSEMGFDNMDVAVPGAGSIIGFPFDSLIVDAVEERNVLGELPRYLVKLGEITEAAKTL